MGLASILFTEIIFFLKRPLQPEWFFTISDFHFSLMLFLIIIVCCCRSWRNSFQWRMCLYRNWINWNASASSSWYKNLSGGVIIKGTAEKLWQLWFSSNTVVLKNAIFSSMFFAECNRKYKWFKSIISTSISGLLLI